MQERIAEDQRVGRRRTLSDQGLLTICLDCLTGHCERCIYDRCCCICATEPKRKKTEETQ